MRWIMLCLLVLCLSACGSEPRLPEEPVIKPCVIPSELANDAMGKLGIRMIHIGNTYRIIIPVDAVFEVRSVEIKNSAYAGLSLLAKRLKLYRTCMSVKGYTDSLGSYADDKFLTEAQARSLITYFWTQGIPHENFNPIGMGKDEAYTVASNRSVNGAVSNRRIEITFKTG